MNEWKASSDRHSRSMNPGTTTLSVLIDNVTGQLINPAEQLDAMGEAAVTLNSQVTVVDNGQPWMRLGQILPASQRRTSQ